MNSKCAQARAKRGVIVVCHKTRFSNTLFKGRRRIHFAGLEGTAKAVLRPFPSFSKFASMDGGRPRHAEGPFQLALGMGECGAPPSLKNFRRFGGKIYYNRFLRRW